MKVIQDYLGGTNAIEVVLIGETQKWESEKVLLTQAETGVMHFEYAEYR